MDRDYDYDSDKLPGIFSTPSSTTTESPDLFDNTLENTANSYNHDSNDYPQAQYTASYNSDVTYDNTSYTPNYTNTSTNATQPSAYKDTPVNQNAISTEWQQYHSAWQNYYQKYYSEYYAQAAQNYLESEKLKFERIATGKKHKKHHYKRLIPIFALGVLALTVLFLEYNRLIFAPIMAYVAPTGDSVATSIEAVNPSVTQSVSADPRLIIPKLNVDVPVAFNIDYNDVMEAMNHGVAQFSIPGANALPGQVGNLVISGHSAGDIYSNNPYKFIFSGLERLGNGDLIYINYESTRYTYQMTDSKVVEPNDVNSLLFTPNRPVLTLITCTPLGTSRYRLLVIAEQISPSFDANSAPDDNPADNNTDYSMPANEPSLFEQIFGS